MVCNFVCDTNEYKCKECKYLIAFNMLEKHNRITIYKPNKKKIQSIYSPYLCRDKNYVSINSNYYNINKQKCPDCQEIMTTIYRTDIYQRDLCPNCELVSHLTVTYRL